MAAQHLCPDSTMVLERVPGELGGRCSIVSLFPTFSREHSMSGGGGGLTAAPQYIVK